MIACVAVRDLYVRPSPALRRRLNFAAANEDIQVVRYVRRILDRWARDEKRPDPPSVEDEAGPYHVYNYIVADDTHLAIRLSAATHDISVSSMTIRILEAYVPREVELLAQAVVNPPGSGGK